MESLERELRYYQSQHRTAGCKICHLIGVPLIVISLPMLLFNWRNALRLFSLGWGFQFIGHFVFEKNKPVLFSELNPWVVVSALIYVTDGWIGLLSGKGFSKEGLTLRPRKRSPIKTIRESRRKRRIRLAQRTAILDTN